ncbi:protein-export membrane protein SecF [Hydrogenobacter thermophilus TK-6]|uniref:Protein-export membrane protein SecF n=1 Tax=Hydrogenobacter thermophilus (strain DSM 6534 / IAM 12695 / TK-6) TaxID=608538 RepID=D3DJT6_HYDTT|nr:protein translocase subunit SecF [Hydrogenobacter thermophilus]ADO46010.1 protein-export membrane protein SecF [Hydrogenobacter thermophilus TK-6]BAI70088.1 protein-export membrane protein [Hydrogenobacter thermophilus TK-6]
MRQIDFMSLRFYAYVFSALLVLLSFLSLYWKGLNLGLDFTGGTVIEVRYSPKIDIGKVREAIQKAGLSSVQVQDTASGTVLVKLKLGESREVALQVLKKLGNAEIVSMQTIGGVISDELRKKAIWSLLVAIGGIMLYLGYRFEPVWAFSGVVALAHDVLVVVGAYSLTQREISLDVVASFLIVAGYSMSDTVVVFDRIRESLRVRKATDLKQVINLSINQTLSRTLMTSLTVLVVAIALFLLGGPALSNIMFAFVIGIAVGTLSSIFVASALMLDIKSKLFKVGLQKT